MYPPHHQGGYELSCRDVVDRLRARGHDVLVLTTTMRVDGVVDPPGERAGGVRRDLEMYLREGELWRPGPRRRLAVERHNQRVLRDALASFRPEVVSVWHMGAMSTGLLSTLVASGVPLVYAVCDDWLIYGVDLDPWMRPFTRRRLRPFAGAVAALTGVPTRLPDIGRSGSFLFVSEVTREAAASWSRWSYPDATVVHSGIDRRDFPPTPPDERPWGWRLLYVGRIDERKGIFTLVRAMAALPPAATLEIVGRGNDADVARLRGLVNDLGLGARVTVDAADRSELRDRYLAADVVVFPSEWSEPFGLVPLEAMACARPVVATGVGGSAGFLADGVNCVLFAPGDADALADALRRVASDEALRRRIVAGGARTAEALDVDRLADTFERWHDAAASRFADGRPPERPPPAPPAPPVPSTSG
jgi:glycosyltransferase involved in cell wall biosynthesis